MEKADVKGISSRTKKATSRKRNSAKKRTMTKKRTTAKKKIAARKAEGTAAAEMKGGDAYSLDNVIEQLKELGERVSRTTDKGVHEVIDVTRSRLQKFRTTLSDAADKGVSAVKDVAEKIHQFSTEATDVTRLKLELHNLQKEHEKLLLLIGEQVRNMYKSDKLRNIKSKLKFDFKKLDELESGIKETEKEIDRLVADLKAIK